jgi:hypothetical protein
MKVNLGMRRGFKVDEVLKLEARSGSVLIRIERTWKPLPEQKR